MWISKKKWQVMKERETDLERKIQSQQVGQGIHEITLYADNETYLKELRICVSGRDWYLLTEQDCYQELIQYVQSLQTLKKQREPCFPRRLSGNMGVFKSSSPSKRIFLGTSSQQTSFPLNNNDTETMQIGERD